MKTRTKLIRKIIPLMAITGSTAGLSAAMLELAGSKNGVWGDLLTAFIYILAGTVLGFLVSEILERRGKDILSRNEKGEPVIVNQPAYLMTGLAAAAALVINWKHGIGLAIVAALFLGFNFLLGISNGIFDYRDSVTKNTLYAGIVPVGFTFIYGYYINHSEAAISMSWLLGSIYLYTYLLFINRMQLDSIIFFRKSVNVEDGRKIRIKNDIMISIFYCVYVVLFNFRNMVQITREGIEKFITWFFHILEVISNWLIVDIPDMARQPLEKVDDLKEGEVAVQRPWLVEFLKILMYVLLIALCIGILIALIGFAVKLIRKIRESMRLSYNRRASEKRVTSDEYVEESEIIRQERNEDILKVRKKKFKYNLKELSDIPLASDKVRYLYGFVLERLYSRHIPIERSDTPDEIMGKIKEAKNGDRLEKLGFDEFTEKYERVRYGMKDEEPADDLVEKGEAFEEAVSRISVEEEENKFSR